MKNKTIIIGLVFLLLIGTVFAVTSFNNREDAWSFFISEKETRDSNIESSISTVNYTTDKICTFDYDTETTNCRVCFDYEYTINRVKHSDNTCVGLPEGTTLEKDEEIINSVIKASIETNYPKEVVEYTERVMTGGSLSVN